MKQRDEYVVDCKVHNPRPVNLVTFYGKRKDKLGTLFLKIMSQKRYLFGSILKVKQFRIIDI